MKTTIILDGPRADTYHGQERHLQKLVRAGVIREATDEDRERIRRVERVSYPRSGASWGDGEYVLKSAKRLYAMDNGFNYGHLELAIKRLVEDEYQAKRENLYDRLTNA